MFPEFRSKKMMPRCYILSLHLMPGWGAQSAITMAREFWYSQKRLHVDLSNLRLTFRDTKAFDLTESKYCSCSRWATMLDWLVPFLYVFTNEKSVLTQKLTKLSVLASVFLIGSSLYRRIGRLEHDDDLPYFSGTVYGWVLFVCILIPVSTVKLACIMWAVSVSKDFTKRYNRVMFCTHLLDPKLEAFVGSMKKTYKVHCFAALGKISKKVLKKLSLHTIDLYNPDSIYSWSQLRNIIFDCGKHFLLRQQAYNGILIVYAICLIFLFLYTLLNEFTFVFIDDLLVIAVFQVSILIPSMWTLSCANSLNSQTHTQKRLLCMFDCYCLFSCFVLFCFVEIRTRIEIQNCIFKLLFICVDSLCFVCC